jgi:Icc protein
MRIVQITDTHLIPHVGEKFLGVDTFLTLCKAVDKARSLKPQPDAFVVTGDIAEGGDAATYHRFREIFEEYPIAVFVVPGNHDDERVMAEVFRGSNIQTVDHAVIGECLCIFIDSHVHQKSHGFLNMASLQRVEALLKIHADMPAIISLHHPPFSPCPAPGCKLQGEDELMQILRTSSSPIAILSGHLHREIDETQGNIRLLTSPSTFAQCQHPIDGQSVDLTDFWGSHQMDMTRHGFRVLDFSEADKFQTEIHWT